MRKKCSACLVKWCLCGLPSWPPLH